jgi:hypothetical protein
VVGKMVRGKQGAWCRSKDPIAERGDQVPARRTYEQLPLDCIHKRHTQMRLVIMLGVKLTFERGGSAKEPLPPNRRAVAL